MPPNARAMAVDVKMMTLYGMLKSGVGRLMTSAVVRSEVRGVPAYDLAFDDFEQKEAVVFPKSSQDVSRVIKLCTARGVPYTARGAGTGLSGGAIPSLGGVLISFARMNRLLEVDLENLRARAQEAL